MANTGLLVVLLIITISHHGSPMCAPDMKGRVCKDMMFPPELSNCIKPTHDNWPCQLAALTSTSTGHDKHAQNKMVDFLENELNEGHRGGGGGLLEVSGVIEEQVQQIKGCEAATESPTTYPEKAIQGVPYVRYEHADQSAEYLLMMVDLDAPSNPKFCNEARDLCTYLHWVVPHIPGQMLLQRSRLDKVAPILEYRPPAPPSGVHRYQVLLFEMHAGQDVHDLPDEQHRDSFDLNYFIGGNMLCDNLRAAFQYRVQHVAP